jgi:hypothetical protein
MTTDGPMIQKVSHRERKGSVISLRQSLISTSLSEYSMLDAGLADTQLNLPKEDIKSPGLIFLKLCSKKQEIKQRQKA